MKSKNIIWLAIVMLATAACSPNQANFEACNETLNQFVAAAHRGDSAALQRLINRGWAANMGARPERLAQGMADAFAEGVVDYKFGKNYDGVIRLHFNVVYADKDTRAFWMSFAEEGDQWKIINMRELAKPL